MGWQYVAGGTFIKSLEDQMTIVVLAQFSGKDVHLYFKGCQFCNFIVNKKDIKGRKLLLKVMASVI